MILAPGEDFFVAIIYNYGIVHKKKYGKNNHYFR